MTGNRRAALALLALGSALTSFAAQAATPETAEPSTSNASDIIITGSRTANASINGLEVDPLMLPQNVRLLDEKLIQETGFTDLSQLFDLAGGMARQNSFGGAWDAYAIRGFSGDVNQGPDLLVNRFTANRGFNARRDIATVESFQVLKGPASALSGKGEPGGSINIVTKAPRDVFHAGGELSYGSFNAWRGSFDIGGPAATGLGIRAIGVYQDGDTFRDFGKADRLLFAPSVAWSPAEHIRFLYQFEYNLVHFVHDRGVVAVNGNGKALPRERFLGEPNDGLTRQRTSQHQASVTIDLADGIAIEAGAQYREGALFGQSSQNSLLVGTRLRRQLRVHDYHWEDLSGRVELSVNRRLFGLEHQLRFGGDLFSYDQRRRFFRFSPTAANPYDIDIYNPVYGQPKPVAAINQDLLEQLRGESLYAQDLISIGKHVSLLLGLRHDWIRQENINYRNTSTTRQNPSVTSPRAALTIAPSDQFSAYISWGKSFRFNQGVDAQSNPFAPERGEVFESGIKYALLGGKLTGTLSLFKITKDNILVSEFKDENGKPVATGFQVPTGQARSKGVEFDLNWHATPRLDITAVYALTDTKITHDTRPGLVGSALSNVPRHSGALYAHWQSRGTQAGSIGIGAGLTYVGERAGDDINSGFRLPDYLTARLNLSCRLTDTVAVHLDAENLFDTYYLESSYSDVWITPGTPRTIRARVAFSL